MDIAEQGLASPGPNLEHRLLYNDLRDWLVEAERLGELRTITGASWEQDIGLACTLVKYSDNTPALLFDEIPGCPKGFRVLANFFGGKRKHLTLGFPPHLDKVELSERWSDAYNDEAGALIPPVYVENGPVLENVLTGDDVDVLKFPAPRWHDADGGRFIGTGCYCVTQDLELGWYNLGSYRVMVVDGRTVGFNTGPGKHGRHHMNKYAARGEKMPVAMVVGGDPMAFLLGGYEVPNEVSEFDVLGGLRGAPVELVRGRITGLPFPANAEIVLEGYVDPETLVEEGPFGDWCGYYTEKGRMRPICEVKAIYHRNDPIILGFPPQHLPDEYSRFRAITRSALLRKNVFAAGVPDVKAVWCHEIGGSRMLTGISIVQRYPGHATQAGHVASQCRAGAFAGKWVIVVDDDIDVSDLEELIWAALTRCDPRTEIDFITNAWTANSDPRLHPDEKARGNATNSRMIIDACRPFHWRHEFPPSTKPSAELLDLARRKFGYLLE
jgi:4-hydroxy-3-polyprenylbenzoate decarboxylase